MREANAVRTFAEQIVCIEPDAKVVVLGDLNEFNAFPAMQVRRPYA